MDDAPAKASRATTTSAARGETGRCMRTSRSGSALRWLSVLNRGLQARCQRSRRRRAKVARRGSRRQSWKRTPFALARRGSGPRGGRPRM